MPRGSPHRARPRHAAIRWLWFGLAAATLLLGYGALRPAESPSDAAARMPTPLDVARSILHRYTAIPPPGLARPDDLDPASWSAWLQGRDRDIRQRLARGDEESIVNLWLFGTSFTSRPRATDARLAALGSRSSAALLLARADDLIAGMKGPGDNERLRAARQILDRAGVALSAPSGRLDATRFLFLVRHRMMTEVARLHRDRTSAEHAGNVRAAMDAYATYYRTRGLSSDTSLLARYSVERARDHAARRNALSPASIHRVAVVGPGLDFVDKAEGYDVYPLQTLQPIALIDSLRRLGLAAADLQVTAFDISPRVLDHLQAAVTAARSDRDYVVHLPLDPDEPGHNWHRDFVEYWRRFGDHVGVDTPPMPPPAEADGVRLRAVRVRADVVRQLRGIDLNVVLERMTPDVLDRPFDLIVATNVLVYYPPAEQALAFANMLGMLRQGGALVTNAVTLPVKVDHLSEPVLIDVLFDQQDNGDTLFWFTPQRGLATGVEPAVSR